jgi:hypothetical protein
MMANQKKLSPKAVASGWYNTNITNVMLIYATRPQHDAEVFLGDGIFTMLLGRAT